MNLLLRGVITVCLTAALSLAISAARAQSQDPPKPSIPGLGNVKGPVSPDINPDALWDGRKMAPFHSLDMPTMVKASEADFLDPTDYVLGVTVQGQSRAYPTRFIWWHHVINDKVTASGKGDTAFAVTYCSVCNTGIRYDLSLNGKPVRLDFFGLYNGVVTLCDRASESVFLQASGKFVTGPLLGKELKMGSILDTTWGEWKRLHPDTVVMSPDSAYSRFYRPKDQPEPRGYDHFPAPFFRPTVTKGDKRLPPFDKVLGVSITEHAPDAKGNQKENEKDNQKNNEKNNEKDGEKNNEKNNDTVLRRAYPIKAIKELGGVINDRVGAMAVAVFLDPATDTAQAVSPVINGKTLTFEARKAQGDAIAFFDKETGTRWNIEGKAEEGPLAGKSLERLECHLSQWYGWFAYFPETTLFGHSEAPQPGDPFESEPTAKPENGESKKP